jgi:uncharacterized protein with ATP-grasp and redox domains
LLAYLPQNTEEIKKRALKAALEATAETSLEFPPSQFTSEVLSRVYEVLGNCDPFHLTKQKENELGEKLYFDLKPKIANLPDPIFGAIKAAACGNIIDVGPATIYLNHQTQNLKQELKNLFETPFKINHYARFKERLKAAQKILYILDNAGEIFLDKLLIEQLQDRELYIAVKAYPILNDALKEDALRAGLDKLGKIIVLNQNTNKRYLGIDFDHLTPEFLELYEESDIVIAKGHANFESLVDTDREVFFILVAKCPVVANKLGIEVGFQVFYAQEFKED